VYHKQTSGFYIGFNKNRFLFFIPLENRDLKEDIVVAGMGQVQFEQIFHSHYEAIRNYIYYKSGSIDEAEDIAQEAFLKIWEKRETIIQSTVKSLLYTIAGNIFLNRWQHRNVEIQFAMQYGSEGASSSPEYDLEMKEFDEKLQNALSALTEKSRTVFLMNRIDCMTYKDIANSLDISVKAVEKRMNKALTFLRETLEVKI
jgi:RNA polymerase sigma-70 factor (family 1)